MVCRFQSAALFGGLSVLLWARHVRDPCGVAPCRLDPEQCSDFHASTDAAYGIEGARLLGIAAQILLRGVVDI